MRFYFDTDDGERRVADRAGTELPDEGEAMEQAAALLRDLSHVRIFPDMSRGFTVRVRRADGRALCAASLVLTVERLG